jgi:hypothetical protein
MSAKGSCPDEHPQVGERQVDTLTSYTLRSMVGTEQPRADAWLRLRTYVQTGHAVPILPEVSLLSRFWHSLTVVGPRLSSAGAALAMLALFIHSSLTPLAPSALNEDLSPVSTVPAIKAQIMDDYLATQGASPHIIPVFKANEVQRPHMVPDTKPQLANVPDPLPNLRPTAAPVAETPDPLVHVGFGQSMGNRDNLQADPLPHY